MALGELLKKAVPLEYWGNAPASRWMLAATVVAMGYIGLPLTSDATGIDLDALFEVSPLLMLCWAALLCGWLATRRAAPGWAIHLHRGLCVVYVAPVFVLVVALTVSAAVGIALLAGIARGASVSIAS